MYTCSAFPCMCVCVCGGVSVSVYVCVCLSVRFVTFHFSHYPGFWDYSQRRLLSVCIFLVYSGILSFSLSIHVFHCLYNTIKYRNIALYITIALTYYPYQ